jgi:hypothetical protein
VAVDGASCKVSLQFWSWNWRCGETQWDVVRKEFFLTSDRMICSLYGEFDQFTNTCESKIT